MMRATKFEFEQRFWLIGAIFWVGFSLTFFDHTSSAETWLRWVAPGVPANSPQEIFLLRVMFATGAVLVFLAAALRTWATAYLRTEIVHDAPQHTETLVADGPYRYLRNPLYFANVPMAAGVGVMASAGGWIFMVVAMWFFMVRLIVREEEGLLATQGESFRAYMQAVPRFWPALTPRVPEGGIQPRWGQAFAGEMFIWLFGVAVLCFAVTLNIKISAIVFVSAMAFYFLAVFVVKKRAATAKA